MLISEDKSDSFLEVGLLNCHPNLALQTKYSFHWSWWKLFISRSYKLSWSFYSIKHELFIAPSCYLCNKTDNRNKCKCIVCFVATESAPFSLQLCEVMKAHTHTHTYAYSISTVYKTGDKTVIKVTLFNHKFTHDEPTGPLTSQNM